MKDCFQVRLCHGIILWCPTFTLSTKFIYTSRFALTACSLLFLFLFLFLYSFLVLYFSLFVCFPWFLIYTFPQPHCMAFFDSFTKHVLSSIILALLSSIWGLAPNYTLNNDAKYPWFDWSFGMSLKFKNWFNIWITIWEFSTL